MSSVSFDRIADRYDLTRGGEQRGRAYAESIHPWFSGTGVEIGVGTGVVSLGLTQLGHRVVGFDLSRAMLDHARNRLGARIAIADAVALPARSAAFGTVICSWVLHLVGDQSAVMHEVKRVLRPGGHLVVCRADSGRVETDIDAIVTPMLLGLRPPRDTPARLVEAASGTLLQITHTTVIDQDRYETTPNEMIELIEQRTWSSLWDLSEPDWNRQVTPVLDALRELPGPQVRRERSNRHELIVFTRT